MPTHQPLLPRIEPLPFAGEVEHPQGVVGAGRVPFHNRMPAAAVGAAQGIANPKSAFHH